MTSPACEVKNGAGSYTATTNGVDVTAGATIIIRLASQAGVGAWSIACIGTDETNDAATISASLVIDSALKTATFTAPAVGSCLVFRSIVNGGVDINGAVVNAYTTTFTVHTLTTQGYRVGAFGETTESNATTGWIEKLNDAIRNMTAGATGPTGPGGTGATGPAGSDYAFTITTPSDANYQVLITDRVICIPAITAARTYTLPASPSAGATYIIKDSTGKCFLYNVTIVPTSGNIDGQANYVMDANYQSVTVVYNGTQWNIV